MPKVVQKCVASICLHFSVFKILWHIHALHCYLVHDIVLNFDDNGNLRTTKSIQKVMKSEACLLAILLTQSRSFSKEVGDRWSCWLLSRAHVIHRLHI